MLRLHQYASAWTKKQKQGVCKVRVEHICNVLIIIFSPQEQKKLRSHARLTGVKSAQAPSQGNKSFTTLHGKERSRHTVSHIPLCSCACGWPQQLYFCIFAFFMPLRPGTPMLVELLPLLCCCYRVSSMQWRLQWWITCTSGWQHFWLNGVSSRSSSFPGYFIHSWGWRREWK